MLVRLTIALWLLLAGSAFLKDGTNGGGCVDPDGKPKPCNPGG